MEWLSLFSIVQTDLFIIDAMTNKLRILIIHVFPWLNCTDWLFGRLKMKVHSSSIYTNLFGNPRQALLSPCHHWCLNLWLCLEVSVSYKSKYSFPIMHKIGNVGIFCIA